MIILSLCQISSKSLEPRPRYGGFGFFKMAAAAILAIKPSRPMTRLHYSDIGGVSDVLWPVVTVSRRPRFNKNLGCLSEI